MKYADTDMRETTVHRLKNQLSRGWGGGLVNVEGVAGVQWLQRWVQQEWV